MATAAQAQHGVAETATRGPDGFLVVETAVLEGTERVGAEHFGPLIGVVAGGIPTGKDVAEGAEQGIFFDRLQHRRRRGNLATQLFGALAAVGGPAAVQP